MIFRFLCLLYGIYTIYVVSKPRHMVSFLGISFIIDAFAQSYGFETLVFRLGGVSLYAGDMPIMAMVLILIASKAKLLKSWVTLLWSIMFCMIIFSLVNGLLTYGVNIYFLSDVRIFLQMSIPIIYFYLRPVSIDKSAEKKFFPYVMILVSYCFFAWILKLGMGIDISSNQSLRVFGSTYAFVIAMFCFCNMYNEIAVEQRGSLSKKSLILLTTVVVLQHNSVWAAFAAGIATVLVLNVIWTKPENILVIHNKKLYAQILIGCVAIVVFLVAFSNSDLVQSLLSTSDKYSQMGTGEGSIGDRQTIWVEYLATLSKNQWLIGKPMGTGWTIWHRGSLGMFPPHNAYVQGVMRIGLIGVVSLFSLIGTTIVKAIKEKQLLAIGILTASVVYLYAYMFSWEVSCIWGIIIGVMWRENDKYLV